MLPTQVMLNMLLQITVAAAIVKSLIDLIVWVYDSIIARDTLAFTKRAASIVLSVLFCLYAGMNAMPLVGVESASMPTVGAVLTGLLMARGANYLHDVLRLIPSR